MEKKENVEENADTPTARQSRDSRVSKLAHCAANPVFPEVPGGGLIAKESLESSQRRAD